MNHTPSSVNTRKNRTQSERNRLLSPEQLTIVTAIHSHSRLTHTPTSIKTRKTRTKSERNQLLSPEHLTIVTRLHSHTRLTQTPTSITTRKNRTQSTTITRTANNSQSTTLPYLAVVNLNLQLHGLRSCSHEYLDIVDHKLIHPNNGLPSDTNSYRNNISTYCSEGTQILVTVTKYWPICTQVLV